jgi:hypothetical protein
LHELGTEVARKRRSRNAQASGNVAMRHARAGRNRDGVALSRSRRKRRSATFDANALSRRLSGRLEKNLRVKGGPI